MPANCPPESLPYVWLGIVWLLFMLGVGSLTYWSGHTAGRGAGRLEGFDAGYRTAKRKYKV